MKTDPATTEITERGCRLGGEQTDGATMQTRLRWGGVGRGEDGVLDV